MIYLLIEILWLLLPAGIANMAPVFATKWNWFPSLNKPLDNNARLHGRRVLGKNKTVRGVVVGVVTGSIVGYVQHVLFGYDFIQSISLVSYRSTINALFVGALLGIGALAGDAVKSFIKRRMNRKAGTPFPIFDQIDFVIGALIAGSFIARIELKHAVLAIIFIGTLSLITSAIGVATGVKENV